MVCLSFICCQNDKRSILTTDPTAHLPLPHHGSTWHRSYYSKIHWRFCSRKCHRYACTVFLHDTWPSQSGLGQTGRNAIHSLHDLTLCPNQCGTHAALRYATCECIANHRQCRRWFTHCLGQPCLATGLLAKGETLICG